MNLLMLSSTCDTVIASLPNMSPVVASVTANWANFAPAIRPSAMRRGARTYWAMNCASFSTSGLRPVNSCWARYVESLFPVRFAISISWAALET